MNEIFEERRSHVFITEILRKRGDLCKVKKFEAHFKFEDFLKKLQELKIDIANDVVVTDDILHYPPEEKASIILVAGFSLDEKIEGKYIQYITTFAQEGVPIIIVSGENVLCDFVLLDFDERDSAKTLRNIVFSCLKTNEFRKKCPFKKIYCENKEIFTAFKGLVENLQHILRRFPEVAKTKKIPIFTYSFFLDFLVWQKLMGEDLSIMRYEKYKKDFGKLASLGPSS